MALKYLKAEEMTEISGAWVDPSNPAHQVLSSTPSLQGLIAVVAERHAALLAASLETPSRRHAESVERAADLDSTHDQLATAIYGFLTYSAQLSATEADLIALRDLLMPNGLAAVVNATFRGQAGFAGVVRASLTDAHRQQLSALQLAEGTLEEKVDAWLLAASELGRLEEERARADEDERRENASVLPVARYAWMRMVGALLAVAEMTSLTEVEESLLFSPLRDAERTADQRARRRSSAGQSATEADVAMDGAPDTAPGDQPLAAQSVTAQATVTD